MSIFTIIDDVIFRGAEGLGWVSGETTIGALVAFAGLWYAGCGMRAVVCGLWYATLKLIYYFVNIRNRILEELADVGMLRSVAEQEPRIKEGDETLNYTKSQVVLDNVSLAYSESGPTVMDT